MVKIFSSEKVEGLEGVYATPALASIIDFNGCTLAYTDNKRLIALAKEANVPVKDFPKQPPTGKAKTNTPSPTKIEEVVTPSNGVLEMPQVKVASIADDINAGILSDEAMMNKHSITKRKLSTEKTKITKAKNKAEKDS